MGSVADGLRDKLQRGLDPQRLDIVDDSDRHAGHRPGHTQGESHFNITIVSSAFVGLSRVERQRLVYALLNEELAGPVHALQLTVLAPGEG
jgi:BolA family transcriptional regulator, general stress-responsive regulator